MAAAKASAGAGEMKREIYRNGEMAKSANENIMGQLK